MDLIEQLRRDAYVPHFTSVGAANLMIRAADEIELLRAALLDGTMCFEMCETDSEQRAWVMRAGFLAQGINPYDAYAPTDEATQPT